MLSEKTLKKIKDRNKKYKITEVDIEEKQLNQQEDGYTSKKNTEALEGVFSNTTNDLKDNESTQNINSSVDLGVQTAINNKNKSNKISISNIAIKVENELLNQREDDYAPIKTSRTIERNFVRIIEALNQNKEEYKDEYGNYSVEIGV